MPQDNIIKRNGQYFVTDLTRGTRKVKVPAINMNDPRDLWACADRLDRAGHSDAADELVDRIIEINNQLKRK